MEEMSPVFAVFNGHINNADKRARSYMARRCPRYLAEVERMINPASGSETNISANRDWIASYPKAAR